MLLINCPSHGRQVLVTESRIRLLTNTDSGILLDIECWCGTHVALRTGRNAAARTATPATMTTARTPAHAA